MKPGPAVCQVPVFAFRSGCLDPVHLQIVGALRPTSGHSYQPEGVLDEQNYPIINEFANSASTSDKEAITAARIAASMLTAGE